LQYRIPSFEEKFKMPEEKNIRQNSYQKNMILNVTGLERLRYLSIFTLASISIGTVSGVLVSMKGFVKLEILPTTPPVIVSPQMQPLRQH
jgi:uncharacterized membrane protein YkgB